MRYDAVAFLKSLFREPAGVTVGIARTAPAPDLTWDSLTWDDLPADWRLEFEERAAIMEYDGGLPRERAEAEALKDILEAMRQAELFPR